MPSIRIKTLAGSISGSEIRKARLAAKMSQLDLAKMLKTTQSNISAIEQGERSVTMKTLAKVAKATKHKFNVPILVPEEK